MLLNLLTNVIVWVHMTLKNIFSKPDHEIIDCSMEYQVNNEKTPSELDEFWEDEFEEWDGETEHFYKNLMNTNYKNTQIPGNIKKTVVRLKYWYNDKMYKYLTYDMGHAWPPQTSNGISFNIPIVSAHLLDSYDKPVKDLLNKIKRYAGPRFDFHGEKVKISDMLYYDDETLEQDFPTIRLRNALGMVKHVSTVDGYVTDLRVP